MCAELVAPFVLLVPGAAEVCGGGGRLDAAEAGVTSVIVSKLRDTAKEEKLFRRDKAKALGRSFLKTTLELAVVVDSVLQGYS